MVETRTKGDTVRRWVEVPADVAVALDTECQRRKRETRAQWSWSALLVELVRAVKAGEEVSWG